MDSLKKTAPTDGATATAASIGCRAPSSRPVRAVDPAVARADSVFAEALHQSRPLAKPGSGLAARTISTVRRGNAQHAVLRRETARRFVEDGRYLQSFVRGAHPAGTAAEVVAAHALKVGEPIVNAGRTAPNVTDVRVATDGSSRRDILFLVQGRRGLRFYVGGGQVKTGQAGYLTRTLEPLPQQDGYGATAYVDAGYVADNGSPRVGPGAFSQAQAARLRKSGVKLRGIRDLHLRGEQLVRDVRGHGVDGLRPTQRARLVQLRDDIARAHRPGAVAGRVLRGAAVGAATAAVLTLCLQVASDGEVDVDQLGNVGVRAGLLAAGGQVADATLFQVFRGQGVPAETARTAAANSVAVGFCALAVGADALAELRRYGNGGVTRTDAVAGIALKSSADVLPIMCAPLGLAAVPIVVGGQLLVRGVLSRYRAHAARLDELDATTRRSVAEELARAKVLSANAATDDDHTQSVLRDSAALEDRIHRTLGLTPTAATITL